jgi:hypothetical protein
VGGGGGIGGWRYNIYDFVFVFCSLVELFYMNQLFCVCTILMPVLYFMSLLLPMIIGSVIKSWIAQGNYEECVL